MLCHVTSPCCQLASLCHRRYTSLGLPYSFERVPCTEDMVTMLLHSPIARAAQVRHGWHRRCGAFDAGCQVSIAVCATGADASAAVRGGPGQACQSHTSTGAVPAAAGQGGANTVSGVQRYRSRERTPVYRLNIFLSHPSHPTLYTGCCGTQMMAMH